MDRISKMEMKMILFKPGPNLSTVKIEKVGPCLTYISIRRWPIYRSNLVLKPCSFLISNCPGCPERS